MDVLDELFGVGLLVAGSFGRLGSGGVDGGLVVEAVQVAAGLLEILDPFLRLLESVSRCVSFILRPVVPTGASTQVFFSFFQVRTSAIIMWQSKVPFP